MSHTVKTLELARIYENQGCIRDAYDMYCFLKEKGRYAGQKDKENEIEKACNRLKERITMNELNNMDDDGQAVQDLNVSGGSEDEKRRRLSQLLEKWISLLIISQRLDNFKKLRSRLL